MKRLLLIAYVILTALIFYSAKLVIEPLAVTHDIYETLNIQMWVTLIIIFSIVTIWNRLGVLINDQKCQKHNSYRDY